MAVTDNDLTLSIKRHPLHKLYSNQYTVNYYIAMYKVLKDMNFTEDSSAVVQTIYNIRMW